MKNTKKRKRISYLKERKRVAASVLAWLLVFLLCLEPFSSSAVSAVTYASENGSSVTQMSEEPALDVPELIEEEGQSIYLIQNKEQLLWFVNHCNSTSDSTYVDSNARLMNDITLNDLSAEGSTLLSDPDTLTNWVPIANGSLGYTGTFDGNGHTIYGLYYNYSVEKDNSVGLFGTLNLQSKNGTVRRGTVKNVTLKNCYIRSSASHTGGIAGNSYAGIIDHCEVYGVILTDGTSAGGILSANRYLNNRASYRGEVTYCKTNVFLCGDGNLSGVGGIVAQNNAYVAYCEAYGTVSGRSTSGAYGFCGGLVGALGAAEYKNYASHYGLVVNSYSHAVVSSSGNGTAIGALVGKPTGGYMINCYASGYENRALGTVEYRDVVATTGMKKNAYYYEYAGEDGTTCGAYRQIAYNCYLLSDRDTKADAKLSFDEVYQRTKETFASGQVAYELNHPDETVLKRLFDYHQTSETYGQYLSISEKQPADEMPRFISDPETLGSRKVNRITYRGDYEGIAYCNESTKLPSAELPYFYEFTCENEEGDTISFTGTEIEKDTIVTVTKQSAEPVKNNEGYFEIKNKLQFLWFVSYVNGAVTIEGEDARHAKAVLLNDLDLSDTLVDPIGTITTKDGTASYENAFCGTFDGQYHVINGLTINKPDQNYVGLFGATYGARIERLGLTNVSISGKQYVGGIVGKAVATKIISCYVTGETKAALEFTGGIVGSAGISREDSSSFDSQFAACEIYRCYAAVSMQFGTMVKTAGGIVGECATAEDVKNTFSDCYYDQEKAGVKGAVVAVETAADDVKNRVMGLPERAFSSGKVCWYLQLACMQAGETSIVKKEAFDAYQTDTVSDGCSDHVIRSRELIWCQDVSVQHTPQFAEYKTSKEKEQAQIMRYTVYDENQIYQENGTEVSQYGNRGFVAAVPDSVPEHTITQDGKTLYFGGWTRLKGSTVYMTETSVTVEKDTYLYAGYDTTGRIFLTDENKDLTITYGRNPATEQYTVKASCSMSKDGSYLTYQWYEKSGEKEVPLANETKDSYRIPADLCAGTHEIFVRVTAQNGTVSDSGHHTVTVKKKELAASLFEALKSCYYTGNPVKPQLMITAEEANLLKKEELVVIAQNNVELTTNEQQASLLITAKDDSNYEGSVTVPFAIVPLPVTAEMYEIIGTKEGEDYLDSVTIKPKEGYLMSNRLNSVYGKDGITLTVPKDKERITNRVGFYIKNEETGAMTEQIILLVMIRNSRYTAPDDSKKDDDQNNTTKQPSPDPAGQTTEEAKNDHKQTGQKKPNKTDPAQKKYDENHELISYYDGLGMPKAGGIYTIGNYRYKVKKVTVTGGSVELIKVVNRSLKKAAVPFYVEINGFRYQVTEIGKKAFANEKKLTELLVGSSVTTIKTKAFYNCKKLKTIRIKSKKLKKTGKKLFTKTARGLIIKVPGSKKKQYKKLLSKKGQKRGKIK